LPAFSASKQLRLLPPLRNLDSRQIPSFHGSGSSMLDFSTGSPSLMTNFSRFGPLSLPSHEHCCYMKFRFPFNGLPPPEGIPPPAFFPLPGPLDLNRSSPLSTVMSSCVAHNYAPTTHSCVSPHAGHFLLLERFSSPVFYRRAPSHPPLAVRLQGDKCNFFIPLPRAFSSSFAGICRQPPPCDACSLFLNGLDQRFLYAQAFSGLSLTVVATFAALSGLAVSVFPTPPKKRLLHKPIARFRRFFLLTLGRF